MPQPTSATDTGPTVAPHPGWRWRRRLGDAARSFAVNAANRNLRRAQLSFAAAWTGEWVLTIALSVVAFRNGGAAAVGVVAFLRMLPAAVLSPVATALADRFRRDAVLRWTCAVRAVALAASAATVGFGASALLAYTFAAVATVAFVVYRPAHSALLPSLCLTPLELTSANVVRGLVDSMSTLIGPGLAAVLLAVADPAIALGCAAALSLAAGLALTGLSYDAGPCFRPGSPGRLLAETIDGFRALPRHPDVFLLVRLTLAQAATRGCFSVLVVVVAIDVLGVGDAGVGALTAAIGAGAVVGSLGVSLFANCRRLATMLGVGVALWGLPLAVVGAIPRDGLILGMLAIVGVGNALVDVGIFTLPPRLVPDEVLARVFGALESLGALVVAGACLVTPVLLGLVGIRWALVIVGAFGPMYVALAWTRLRSIDRTVTRRDLEISLLDELPIFRPLALPVIERLADRLEVLTVDAGETVVAQGDHGERFYVIEHGAARVVCDGVVRRDLVAGDCFGEIALLLDVPRTATVIATTTAQLRSLRRADFLAAVAGHVASRAAADRVVAERLDANSRADDQAAPVETLGRSGEASCRTSTQIFPTSPIDRDGRLSIRPHDL